MLLLVTGASGTLGSAFCTTRVLAGDEVIGASRTKPARTGGGQWRALDIRDPEAVTRLIDDVRPDVVVHCAAEMHEWATTAQGSANVAVAAARRGIRQVHLSTDAVFGGRQQPYREDDLPSPVTPYGAAKAAAETVLATVDPSAAIVRTSLIVGQRGETGRERVVHEAVADPARVTFFTDEIRSPVLLDDLVDALGELADSDQRGILHVAGAEWLSRYELAVLIAQRDGLDARRIRHGLRGDRPGPAEVRLDCSTTQAGLRTRLRGATEFLSPTPA